MQQLTINKIYRLYETLPQPEQEKVRDHIIWDLLRFEKILPPKEVSECPYCNGKHFVKNGSNNGKQRFLCRDCRRTFTLRSGTVMQGTSKQTATWTKYVECLLNKDSIRCCAEICDIALVTAFVWRHKILRAIRKAMENLQLSGEIQADETFMKLSFKGNHKQFPADREPYKRGTPAKKRGLSKEQVCIACAIDSKGNCIAQATNLGRVSINSFRKAFNDKFEPGSTLVTDGLKSYAKFSAENELKHIVIPAGKKTNGWHNIQKINNYHSQFKIFIKPFLGIASKYINNYMAYHHFVVMNKDEEKTKRKNLLHMIRDVHCPITAKTIGDSSFRIL